ncbi:hypothetical protein [Rhizobium sp.]
MKPTASRRANPEIGQVLDIQAVFRAKKLRPEAKNRFQPLYKA